MKVTVIEIKHYQLWNILIKLDQEIQITMTIVFICTKDDEDHVMHSKSDNIEIMINDKVDRVI